MPAVPRRKCCIPCANSKRKCDKQAPECQRCIDRDIDCTYPAPKRSRRQLHAARTGETTSAVSHAYSPLPGSTFTSGGGGGGIGDENYLNTVGLDFSANLDNMIAASSVFDIPPINNVSFPYMPSTIPSTCPLPTTQPILPLSPPSPPAAATQAAAPCPWFLESDTWVMMHCDETPECSTALQLEPFIKGVEQMLRDWITKGQNDFIHHRLYAQGMPVCIADAFTTLSTYMTCTPAVKDTILQIADERAARLVNQQEEALRAAAKTAPYDGRSAAQDIWTQLARVQALFVYEFIRLFDGNIRVRASAELQLPILRDWVRQMKDTIQTFRGDDVTLCSAATQDGGTTQSQFDKDYTAATNLWKLWILSESVRRSHLIIDAVANIFQTMSRGLAECAGAVMFTARAGLWEASSASKWARLSNEKAPLLVASLTPGPLLDQYSADEFDAFAKLYWTFIVGKEKIECWVEKSASARISRLGEAGPE